MSPINKVALPGVRAREGVCRVAVVVPATSPSIDHVAVVGNGRPVLKGMDARAD